MTDKLYSSPHPHLRYMYTFRCGIRISSRTSPISGRKEGLASASSCTSRPSTCKLDRDEHRIISLFTSSHSTSSHRLFRFFKIVLFLSLMNLSPPRPSSAAPHRPQRLAPRPLERQRDAAAPFLPLSARLAIAAAAPAVILKGLARCAATKSSLPFQLSNL